ncbi:TadE/TadG family type IV pilus assembly protein [Limnobacter sp.]|uniref:TadE/TadG family type IV pilus assembly protein n=1 Tax=Limnobacter sp. TaxID=2003368 RepID=UPI003518E10F
MRAAKPSQFLQNRTRQRGAQLIELALMLPVVLTVIFAIVGYSMLFMVQHSLSSAVSQAARSVAVAGSDANPESAARQLLQDALPAAMYPAGFSFETEQLAGAADCGNALGTGTNPSLTCLEFRGFFSPSENNFLANIPFSSTFFPSQLSASAVVLYQNTTAL